MGKFYGIFVAFATFIQIESIAYTESVCGKESSIPTIGHRLRKRGIDDVNITMGSGMGSSYSFDVQLSGSYYWERLATVDNRDRNTSYVKALTITKSIQSSYSDLSEKVLNAALKEGLSLSKDGVVDVLTFEFDAAGSMDEEIARTYQKTVNTKNDSRVAIQIARDFIVPAEVVRAIFQMKYRGPGLTYASSNFSIGKPPMLHNVTFNCRAQHVLMLKSIHVVITSHIDERPPEIITETSSGSPDINRGFEGKYAWLVPIWTQHKAEAVTKVKATVQDQPKENLANMGSGIGAKFRYLEMVKDPSDNRRLKRVGLLRSTMAKPIIDDKDKYGWDDCTSDINALRRGDWLHLCWNYVYV